MKNDLDPPVSGHGGARPGAGRRLGSRNHSSELARYARAKADRAEAIVETKRLAVEARLMALQECAGQLIPADEFSRVLTQVFQVVTTWAETLPDILEREAGLQHDQVESVQRCVDRLRESLPLVPGANNAI